MQMPKKPDFLTVCAKQNEINAEFGVLRDEDGNLPPSWTRQAASAAEAKFSEYRMNVGWTDEEWSASIHEDVWHFTNSANPPSYKPPKLLSR